MTVFPQPVGPCTSSPDGGVTPWAEEGYEPCDPMVSRRILLGCDRALKQADANYSGLQACGHHAPKRLHDGETRVNVWSHEQQEKRKRQRYERHTHQLGEGIRTDERPHHELLQLGQDIDVPTHSMQELVSANPCSLSPGLSCPGTLLFTPTKHAPFSVCISKPIFLLSPLLSLMPSDTSSHTHPAMSSSEATWPLLPAPCSVPSARLRSCSTPWARAHTSRRVCPELVCNSHEDGSEYDSNWSLRCRLRSGC